MPLLWLSVHPNLNISACIIVGASEIEGITQQRLHRKKINKQTIQFHRCSTCQLNRYLQIVVLQCCLMHWYSIQTIYRYTLYSLLYSLQLHGLFLFSTCYVVLSLYLLSATILSTLSTCRVYMALSGDIIPRRRNICFENRLCTKPVYLFTAFIQNRLNFYPRPTLYLSKLCVNCLEQSKNLKSQFQIKISLHFT